MYVDAGADYSATVTFPYAITSYTFSCKIIDLTDDSVAATLTTTITDGANGVLTITLSDTTTGGLSTTAPLEWYLSQTDTSGNISVVCRGSVDVQPLNRFEP